jgi:hypothetical protein
VGESKADLPPSPVVLVLTMDGCVTAFSLACVDRDQYAHPLVHAPLPLPPLPAAAPIAPAPAAAEGGAWGAGFLQANAASGAEATKAAEEEISGGAATASAPVGGFSFGVTPPSAVAVAAAAPAPAGGFSFGVGAGTPPAPAAAASFGTAAAPPIAAAATATFAPPAFGTGGRCPSSKAQSLSPRAKPRFVPIRFKPTTVYRASSWYTARADPSACSQGQPHPRSAQELLRSVQYLRSVPERPPSALLPSLQQVPTNLARCLPTLLTAPSPFHHITQRSRTLERAWGVWLTLTTQRVHTGAAPASPFSAAPATPTATPAPAVVVVPPKAKPAAAAVVGDAPNWGGDMLQKNKEQGALAMKAAEEFMKELNKPPEKKAGGFKFGDKVSFLGEQEVERREAKHPNPGWYLAR